MIRNLDTSLVVLSLIFFGQVILTSLLHSGSLAFRIYGTPNRNTGALTYISLVILMLAAASAGRSSFGLRFVYTLIGVSSLLSVYGLAQWQGLEIFQYVNAYGSNIFSTFGNTNFHSAFMGIAGSAIFAFALTGAVKWRVRIFLMVVLILCIMNIYLSSSQGFLSLAAGCSVTLIFYFFYNRKYLIGTFLSALVILGGTLVTMAVFNFGPLAGIIYEASVKARGFYWSAAINMLMQHPVLGVGMDGYGDWYLRSRNQSAVDYNAQLVSDSAHNIPLDIATSGGLPLLLAYFGIQVLVMKKAIQRVRTGDKLDPIYLSILAAWVAYQTQSLLSINQIGLGIWGWTISGLLVGYGIVVKSEKLKNHTRNKRKSSLPDQKFSRESVVYSVFGLLLGCIVALPPYMAANEFYRTLQSGNIERLIDSVNIKPEDRSRFFYVSQILMENNFQEEAIQILRMGAIRYPDYYPIWLKLAENPESSPALVAKARVELRRLDPLNPEYREQ